MTRSPEFIQLNKGITKLGFPERDKFKKYSEIKNGIIINRHEKI